MPERKRRNEPLDTNLPDFEDDLFEGKSVELGAGYSISLDYTEELPTVYVKTYGEVDSLSLRRKLKQHYPGSKIEGLTSHKLVQINSKKKKPKPKTKK